MDSRSLDKGVSAEVIRESLMAISQFVPEATLTSNESPMKISSPGVDQNGDGIVEEFRSKLISISYTESPTVQPSTQDGKNSFCIFLETFCKEQMPELIVIKRNWECI